MTVGEQSLVYRPPEKGLFHTAEPILGEFDESLNMHKILHGGMWTGQRKWWELPNFIRMLVGGYGCCWGHSLVNSVPIAERCDPSPVQTLLGEAVGSQGYLKGRAELYRVTTQLGRVAVVTLGHRWLTPTGWKRLDQLAVGAVIAGSAYEDDRRCRETSRDSSGRCYWSPRPHGVSPFQAAELAHSNTWQSSWPSTGGPQELSYDHHSRTDSLREVWPQLLAYAGALPRISGLGGWTPLIPQDLGPEALYAASLDREAQPAPILDGSWNGDFCGDSYQSHGQCTADAFQSWEQILPTWDPITSIEYHSFGDYYDLSVPGPEHYLGDGLYHHNSGKTMQLAKRMLTIAVVNGSTMRRVSSEGKRWWKYYDPVGTPPPVAIVSPTYSIARETTLSTIESLLINLELWYAYWRSKPEIEKRWIGYEIKRTAPYVVKIWYKRGRYRPKMGRILIYSGENADKLKGPNIAAVGIDEPFIQPLAVFEQMIARCRHPQARIREVNLTGCVTRDTLVWTRKGLVMIGDLDPGTDPKQYKKLGVEIYGRGGFHEATKFYNNGEDETVILKATNGIELEATPDHPVMTVEKDGSFVFKRLGARKGKYAELGQAQAGDKLPIAVGMDLWGDQDPLEGTGQSMTNDAAYCFGAWVAEGSYAKTINQFRVVGDDNELHEPFLESSLCGVYFNGPGTVCSDTIYKASSDITSLFQYLEMPLVKSPKRWIPRWVTAGKREWALHFLAGMYDSDGHVCTNGQVSVGYSTTSKFMAKQLQSILFNLGVVSSITKTVPSPTDRVKVCSTRYQVRATAKHAIMLAEMLPLRIQRKKEIAERYTKEILGPTRRGAFIKDPSGLSGDQLFYTATIKSLDTARAETVDFVIPDTNTFVSGCGITSYQTPEQLCTSPLERGGIEIKLGI